MGDRGNKRTIKGLVIQNKMDKTVVVRVETRSKHPMFHKYLRRHTKYKAHDATNSCNIGDMVTIVESRPLSREKRWRVQEILERAR